MYEPEAPGPLAYVYWRTVYGDPLEEPSAWERIGRTCFTPMVPARSGEAGVSTQMLIEAFHRTEFALPHASIQPPGGRSLVNLPVYFETTWPETGFEPGEIDTIDMAGSEVRLRPTLVAVTYHTGDIPIGPTTSLGGPYPHGDITYTYTSPTTVNPYISIEYGGEYSINGSPWGTIPSTAVIDGPASPLQLLESRNRLVTPP